MKSWSALPKSRQMWEIMKVWEDPVHFVSPYFLPNLKNVIANKKAEIVREFYARGCNELIGISGMRSGKSTMLAFFAALETFHMLTVDYVTKYNLAPGTEISGVLCSAKEETATEQLFNPLMNYMDDSPYFKYQGYEEYKKVCIFPQINFRIKPIAANAATEAGKTAKFVCIDEFSKIQETESWRGAKEIDRTFTKATKTFKNDGHRFKVGTLRGPNDILVESYDIGKKMKRTLVFWFATWEFNPELKKSDFDEDFQKDPIGAARDFGSEVYAQEDAYFRNPAIITFDQKLPNILEMINDGVTFTGESYSYVLAGDPALKHDAFGLALSHRAGDHFITDGALSLKHGKEVDPREVRRVILSAIDQLDIRYMVFDTWNFPETIQEVKSKGVTVLNHIVKKKDYDFFKSMCWEKKQTCCAYGPLEVEFKSLIQKGDKVDHPKHGSKDVADAVVNTFWVLQEYAQASPGLSLIQVI